MARNFLTGINLNNNELSNVVITNSAPGTKVAGNIWYASQHLTLRGTSADKTIANQDDTLYIGTQAITLNQGSGTITALPGLTSVNGTTIPLSKTLVVTTDTLAALAATTSSQLASVISDETGSGSLVFANTPTLVTPVLGVATASSINKVAITAPATSATLALADGSTLATSGGNSVTLTSTGTTNVTLPTSGTLVTTASKLSVFAATSSSELRGVISDETGTGSLVFSASPTFTGNVTVPTPTNGTDAANKTYVDNAVAGLSWKESVHLLATSNVPLTGNTNTVTIDSHATLTSANSGYRLLLTGQTTAADKGIYDYTDNGTTYTLTRSTDADAYAELNGATTFVLEGTLYGSTSWVQSNYALSSFSGQTWVQFNGAQAYNAGNGLTASGNTFNVVGTTDRISVSTDAVDIASTYVGQTSITTLGTIGTGTWNATTIGTTKGGTGLTSFTSGGAVYATSTSALTTGTLPITAGGTGATTAADARTALSAIGKYTATNSSITPSGGLATWRISAATHGLPTDQKLTVQVYRVDSTTGGDYLVDTEVYLISNAANATSNFGITLTLGDVFLVWNASATVTAGTYRVVITG